MLQGAKSRFVHVDLHGCHDRRKRYLLERLHVAGDYDKGLLCDTDATVRRIGSFRFHFYSDEGTEPPHIHVRCPG